MSCNYKNMESLLHVLTKKPQRMRKRRWWHVLKTSNQVSFSVAAVPLQLVSWYSVWKLFSASFDKILREKESTSLGQFHDNITLKYWKGRALRSQICIWRCLKVLPVGHEYHCTIDGSCSILPCLLTELNAVIGNAVVVTVIVNVVIIVITVIVKVMKQSLL